ncbi:hypothetical protein GCM10007320_43440 [Pseudorhodoferax aquiterrae]|uniref:Sel1 repeat family protein n=1 Tax=Pseudorhodoferax aquiterrae TaxID=747304 RepID=A0ABQ3G790_9BURK|nr:hypothetical protein [Pseudorhodoferax aquiterrae]GHC92906.1 hypothetical protein GCM10007320_43440 [Pseudorhodoferax aquiterrae]
MRRQDIQLRLLAKQGDADARLKLGEAYLQGTSGFVRNVPVALSYLQAALAQAPKEAACTIANGLELQEILEFDQLQVLKTAAEHEDASRLKLAAWRLVCGDLAEAKSLLSRCADSIRSAHAALTESTVGSVLAFIQEVQPMDVPEVIRRTAAAALGENQLDVAVRMLRLLPEPYDALPVPVTQLIVEVIRHAEQNAKPLGSLPISLVECALDRCASSGDVYASHALGRALAGVRCGELPAERLVSSPQLRKAAAYLLRAADGGISEAWLHLYRICADYRGSVANPMMARFCLEKAVQHGIAEAQRRLGALELREATEIESMEKAVSLLFRASRKGDHIARVMLQSLVLPVQKDEAQAQAAIREIERSLPLLAMRLRLARVFGLTKLEAMSVNPASGRRPWGLVVGKNPFVLKMRLAEPRAVPATSEAALECLERAAAMFGRDGAEGTVSEAPLRARTLQQRRIFERLDLSEDLFFASATSQQRDSLRIGTKWAQKQRQTLQMALAD